MSGTLPGSWGLRDRLRHARVMGPAAAAPRASPAALEGSAAAPRVGGGAGFECRECAWPLAPPALPRARSFGEARGGRLRTVEQAGGRSQLLAGSLDRLVLPGARELAEAAVCLGARDGARPVFLDTETTGLGVAPSNFAAAQPAGSAGSGGALPFLVGIAWLDGDQLRLVQWTLARLGAEAEMLAALFGRLRQLGPTPLVSFNGASFDLPLLRRRARRHGLAAGVLAGPHLDLLHGARRLFRGRAADCRLATLEARCLGLRRRGDLPSAEIPTVFWDWLLAPEDSRAQRRLEAVREHNLADLLTLPALAHEFAGSIRRPQDLDGALRAARHLLRVGAPTQARALLAEWVEERARAEERRPEPLLRAAALELATLHRRAGAHRRAGELWRWVWASDPGDPAACEAWAKHLEHQAGDLATALRVAEASREPCAQRIARLRRRLGPAASARNRASKVAVEDGPPAAGAMSRVSEVAVEDGPPAAGASPPTPAVHRPHNRGPAAAVDRGPGPARSVGVDRRVTGFGDGFSDGSGVDSRAAGHRSVVSPGVGGACVRSDGSAEASLRAWTDDSDGWVTVELPARRPAEPLSERGAERAAERVPEQAAERAAELGAKRYRLWR